jgi:glycosyltransferase involved in cell wall biosynthesis
VTAGALHVVVPAGIADPARPSGGNTYDRRMCAALGEHGWRIDVVEVEGGWPWSADLGARHLERVLAAIPGDASVLVDGLLASRLPSVVLPACARLRVVILMHLPVGIHDPLARLPERRVVAAARSVITPSAWSRTWLVEEYALDPGRVHVARPGVDQAPVAPSGADGTALLAVGAVTPVKGQDRLLAALADLRDLTWRCACVGSDSVDLDFADRLLKTSAETGLGDRFVLAGPRTGEALEAAYAAADLLVLPSRAETYGMVVTEALARGLPVVATDVGGVREALGETADGRLPGILVRPDDPAALAAVLRRWLTDPALRETLRAVARERRRDLASWSVTAGLVADVVRGVAA